MPSVDAAPTATTQGDPIRFFAASAPDQDMARRWRQFAETVPWAHYQQDPAWADIVAGEGGLHRPCFFWAERDGTLCLTAIGVRRNIPIPRRCFWTFDRGPTFLHLDVLDEWLLWLRTYLGREPARLRVHPPVPLAEGGDDVETALERHGFVRRRTLGGWATLVADIGADEDELRSSFRSATQRSIRKSQRLGIEVTPEDSSAGRAILSSLQTDLSRHTPVDAVSPERLERVSRLWLKGGAGGTILVARHQKEPLAAALVLTYHGVAHLPLIPSSRRQRELPATHLLVWEAMRWARGQGCTALDFSGYSLVARPGDPLWGINQFKRGFASLDQLQKSVAIHERAGSPLLASSARLLREVQERMSRRASTSVE